MGEQPKYALCYNRAMSQANEENERRSELVLRTLPILLIPVLVAAVTFALLVWTTGGRFQPPEEARRGFGPLVPIVVMTVFLSALIVLVRLGRPTISALLIISVWTLVTTLGALRSGVTSFIPALLVIPICAAGLLIDWVACVSLAALAILLVGSLAWLEINGYLPPPTSAAAMLTDNAPYLALGFWITVFLTVAALTSLLAGGLQRALQQSRSQAAALGELSSQLEARVAAQTTRLLEQERAAATLAERTRLAREIHDTLAQGLTGIVVQLGAAQRALGAEQGAEEHIGLAQGMARELLAEARRSVWNLRAAALERGSLGDALRTLAERPIPPATTASFELRGEPWPVPPEAEAALVRVTQEALANVAKHAEATRAVVLLEYTPDAIRLSVRDNGVGFAEPLPTEQAVASGPWGSFGLLGMRERLQAIGGTLELRNDGGAQVLASVPRGTVRGDK